jgi:hypothetical protein
LRKLRGQSDMNSRRIAQLHDRKRCEMQRWAHNMRFCQLRGSCTFLYRLVDAQTS